MSLSNLADENNIFHTTETGDTVRATLLVTLYAADTRAKPLLQVPGLSSIITSKLETVTKKNDFTNIFCFIRRSIRLLWHVECLKNLQGPRA